MNYNNISLMLYHKLLQSMCNAAMRISWQFHCQHQCLWRSQLCVSTQTCWHLSVSTES